MQIYRRILSDHRTCSSYLGVTERACGSSHGLPRGCSEVAHSKCDASNFAGGNKAEDKNRRDRKYEIANAGEARVAAATHMIHRDHASGNNGDRANEPTQHRATPNPLPKVVNQETNDQHFAAECNQRRHGSTAAITPHGFSNGNQRKV